MSTICIPPLNLLNPLITVPLITQKYSVNYKSFLTFLRPIQIASPMER